MGGKTVMGWYNPNVPNYTTCNNDDRSGCSPVFEKKGAEQKEVEGLVYRGGTEGKKGFYPANEWKWTNESDENDLEVQRETPSAPPPAAEPAPEAPAPPAPPADAATTTTTTTTGTTKELGQPCAPGDTCRGSFCYKGLCSLPESVIARIANTYSPREVDSANENFKVVIPDTDALRAKEFIDAQMTACAGGIDPNPCELVFTEGSDGKTTYFAQEKVDAPVTGAPQRPAGGLDGTTYTTLKMGNQEVGVWYASAKGECTPEDRSKGGLVFKNDDGSQLEGLVYCIFTDKTQGFAPADNYQLVDPNPALQDYAVRLIEPAEEKKKIGPGSLLGDDLRKLDRIMEEAE